MTETVLVVDVGSSGLKAVLFDDKGSVVAETAAEYSTRQQAPGRAEQDPSDWWQAMGKAIAALPGGGPPLAVAFAGTMENMLPLDRDGAPLTPALLYSDGRAQADFARSEAALEAAGAGRILGNAPDLFMTAFKIAWLRENEPTLFGRVATVLPGAKDYLVARLTGALCTDPTNATTTGLMDLVERRWSPEILEILDLPADLLPEIRPAGAVVGAITDVAGAQIGLPAGVPVLNGCGDAGASTVGATGLAGDAVHVYLGTTGWVARTAGLNPGVLPRPFYTLAHPCEGTVIEVAPVLSAGAAPDWFRSLTGADRAEMDAAAEEADREPPQVLFLPYLSGERSPFVDPDVRAAFLGIDGGVGSGDLYYAVLEGVALAIRNCLDALGGAPGSLSVIGGGAASRVWPQLIADACECRVEVSELTTAATALGAYRIAAATLGLGDGSGSSGRIIEPRHDRVARAGRRMDAFRAATEFARAHAARP